MENKRIRIRSRTFECPTDEWKAINTNTNKLFKNYTSNQGVTTVNLKEPISESAFFKQFAIRGVITKKNDELCEPIKRKTIEVSEESSKQKKSKKIDYKEILEITEDPNETKDKKTQKILSMIKEAEPKDYFFNKNNIKKNIMKNALQQKQEGPVRVFNLEKLTLTNKGDALPYTWVLTGEPGYGKTTFALSHFKNPILVRVKEDLLLINESTDGIIFDDFNFECFSPNVVIHMLDLEQETSINVKYGTAIIPKYLPRMITTNNPTSILPEKADCNLRNAILRRVRIKRIEKPCFTIPKASKEIKDRIQENARLISGLKPIPSTRSTAEDIVKEQEEIDRKARQNISKDEVTKEVINIIQERSLTDSESNIITAKHYNLPTNGIKTTTKNYTVLMDHSYFKEKIPSKECLMGCTEESASPDCEYHNNDDCFNVGTSYYKEQFKNQPYNKYIEGIPEEEDKAEEKPLVIDEAETGDESFINETEIGLNIEI